MIAENAGIQTIKLYLTKYTNKGIIMQNKTIQIQVQDGVVIDVLNLPSGVDYEIIDLDISHADEA